MILVIKLASKVTGDERGERWVAKPGIFMAINTCTQQWKTFCHSIRK